MPWYCVKYLQFYQVLGNLFPLLDMLCRIILMPYSVINKPLLLFIAVCHFFLFVLFTAFLYACISNFSMLITSLEFFQNGPLPLEILSYELLQGPVECIS